MPELAREAGLSLHTIRFYEKRGLLNTGQIDRRSNNYKEYGPAALERLHFIAQAKAAGFTLSETADLLRDWHALDASARRTVLENKLRQIEQRKAKLAQMQAYLAAKLAALPPPQEVRT